MIDHLTATGVLAKGQERVLGLFPVTRHPPTDVTADDQVGEAVRRIQQEVMAAITAASSGDGGGGGGS